MYKARSASARAKEGSQSGEKHKAQKTYLGKGAKGLKENALKEKGGKNFPPPPTLPRGVQGMGPCGVLCRRHGGFGLIPETIGVGVEEKKSKPK